MKDRIICFALGLSGDDMERGKASFYAMHKDAHLLEVIPMTDAMLAVKVGDVLDSMMAGPGLSGAAALPPGLFPYRVIVVNSRERDQVLQVMRSFKAVLPDSQDLIFAVITDTVRIWTFGEYIVHLSKEHEQMKVRK